jgi:hypothetical protein
MSFPADPAGYYLILMMFRFQIEVAPGRWLDFGSAQGFGLHSAQSAIHELVKANGGRLRAGSYRYRAVDGITHDWSNLTIDSSRAGQERLADNEIPFGR